MSSRARARDQKSRVEVFSSVDQQVPTTLRFVDLREAHGALGKTPAGLVLFVPRPQSILVVRRVFAENNIIHSPNITHATRIVWSEG